MREFRIARNTAWNLLGMALPILVAVACIPALIQALGAARFGVLTIAWLVLSYFGQFNFGLGRATAKFAAEELAQGGGRQLPILIRSSLIVHLVLGLIGTSCLIFAVPALVTSVFSVPEDLRHEAAGVLYLLAPTIPMILLSDCLRGLLEAHYRFDLIAAVQTPSTALNYLAPLLVLSYTDDLVMVVVATLLLRLIVLLAYCLFCARLVPQVFRTWDLRWDLVRRMLSLGGWVTISSLAVPILTSLDRLTIGAVVSLSAVAWYATPYEVVSKLWLFSGSFLAVMFPVFASHAHGPRKTLAAMYDKSVTMLTAAVLPAAALVIFLGPALFRLWVGEEFAEHGTPVIRLLAVGFAVNVVAKVPFTLLQSIGRARVPALVQLAEVPCYAALAWWLAGTHGIAGVALAWTLRSIADAVALFLAVERLVLRSETTRSFVTSLLRPAAAYCSLAVCAAVSFALPNNLPVEFAFAISAVTCVVATEWVLLLTPVDRESVLGRMKRITGRLRGAV